ncbi:SpoIIE family protein phosphatase [Candidatus Peregrinibacteria bacterium]|nr:SpoIIE family protein phosphatase [Candidatus Peregrinibacteria bacterium]
MRFLKKSLNRKFIAYLTAVIGLMIAVFYRVAGGGADGSIDGEVSFRIFLISLGFVGVLFFLIYWLSLYRPLKIILAEVQALLSGKTYHRIYTDRIDEIGILAHFFNQVTEGFGEVSYDLKEKDRMFSELSVASQLQRDILPLRNPNIKGLQIVAKTKPATEVGGDSFSFLETKDKAYIYIGDVTGHGVAAGLIMTMVNSLITVFTDIYDSAYEALVHVNHYIKRHVKRAMYMTLVMLCWDEKAEKMTYVGAGHEHILVYHSDSGECEAILSGGVALGMVENNSKLIQEKEIFMKEGDFIVLYSDGMTEARNKAGELFGLDRLKAAVKEFASQYSAEGVNYHIARTVTDFMDVQGDDMSLIVIKRGVEGAEPVKDQSIKWNL